MDLCDLAPDRRPSGPHASNRNQSGISNDGGVPISIVFTPLHRLRLSAEFAAKPLARQRLFSICLLVDTDGLSQQVVREPAMLLRQRKACRQDKGTASQIDILVTEPC